MRLSGLLIGEEFADALQQLLGNHLRIDAEAAFADSLLDGVHTCDVHLPDRIQSLFKLGELRGERSDVDFVACRRRRCRALRADSLSRRYVLQSGRGDWLCRATTVDLHAFVLWLSDVPLPAA